MSSTDQCPSCLQQGYRPWDDCCEVCGYGREKKRVPAMTDKPATPSAVEQCDRDAAAEVARRNHLGAHVLIANGEKDGDFLVQVFAARRHAAEKAGLEKAAAIARSSAEAAAAFITNDLDCKLTDDQLALWQRAALYVEAAILASVGKDG